MLFDILTAYDPALHLYGSDCRKESLFIHFIADDKNAIPHDSHLLAAAQCRFNIPLLQA